MAIWFAILEQPLIKIVMSLQFPMPIELVIKVFSFILTFIPEFLPSTSFLHTITKPTLVFWILSQEMTLSLICTINYHAVVLVFQTYDMEITSFLAIDETTFPNSWFSNINLNSATMLLSCQHLSVVPDLIVIVDHADIGSFIFGWFLTVIDTIFISFYHGL